MKQINKQQKINENIKRIKKYFKEDCLKRSFEDLNFYIKEVEIKKEKQGLLNFEIVSIKIITNIKNPKNRFLEDRYFIFLTPTGKIYLLLKNGKKANSLKKLLNKYYLK